MKHRQTILSILALTAWTAISIPPAFGQMVGALPQTQPAPPEPQVYKLTLRPAKAPDPVLRYRFLPDLMDQTPGNAAVIYENAAALVNREEDADKLSELVDAPANRLDKAEGVKLLNCYSGATQALVIAARREKCEWDLPVREQGIAMMLPSLSKFRTLARVQLLEARLYIADGNVDEAVKAMQTNFALARDVAKGPTLIQGLVGVSIAAANGSAIRDLIQLPNGPNLYWALTDLPSPLISLRHAMEYEKSMIFLSTPGLGRADPEKITLEQWVMLHFWLSVDGGQWGVIPHDARSLDRRRMLAAGVGVVFYPRAKEYLLAHGRTPTEVEAMPVHRVLAAYQLGVYEHHRDAIFKWFAVPYPQAAEGFKTAETEMRAASQRMEGWPFLQLLPALSRCYFSATKLDQQIAMLRIVEAIRLHMASHGGALPKSLDEVTEVPIPANPMSGKPFEYRIEGGKAILEAPVPEGGSLRDAVRYELSAP